jgi:hypothetical protein
MNNSAEARALFDLGHFELVAGFCFITPLPPHAISDDIDHPRSSSLILLEDGVPIGSPHSLHAEIRERGNGLFSHWQGALLFSTSDNTDPRANGRLYQAFIQPPLGKSEAAEQAIETLRALPADFNSSDAYYTIERCLSLLDPAAILGDTWKSWWSNGEFLSDYSRLENCGHRRTAERKYTVYQLVRSLHHIAGDAAECGVYNGSTAYFIARAGRETGHERAIHLFDSFAGLSLPAPEDGDYWHKGDLSMALGVATANLAGFPSVRFYPGWIPDRFHEVADRHFAFVHVDTDLYEPTKASIEFFYPRLVPGGMLVCDDYGSAICPGARKAMDDYFAGTGENIIDLPTMQGIVIKR